MFKEQILGVNVIGVEYDKLIQMIIKDLKTSEQKVIVAINPEKIMKALKNEKLKLILDKVDYPIADGVGIIIASRILRGNIKKRITGIDCVELICDKSRNVGAKIFLYGAKKKVVKQAKKNLENKYPGINIVGVIDGYEKDNQKIINKINKSNADILFVALGSPKQEYWIYENKKNLKVKILQGVGGSFDVISGNLKRAPKWMQKIGLEWLYRLLKEPNRLWRQMNIIKFIFLVKRDRKNSRCSK